MSPRFLSYIPFLFKWEGTTYENDPDDPGGATKYGIDQRSHPTVDIKNLTEAEAIEIYHKEYWLPIRGDELPDKTSLVVMDIAVNNGKSRAVRWLQQALNVTVDLIIGPKTLAFAQRADDAVLASRLLDRREQFYHDIAKGRMAKFLRGWLNRNNDLRRFLHV